MFSYDVEDYIKGCDVYLASKVVWHKPYDDLQFLSVSTYHEKDLLMDFITGLPILTDWKRDSDDSIFVIIDWLTKMVYYKLFKVTINA